MNLHKGMFNHLRLYRNASIHDGRQTDQVRKYIYQLNDVVKEVLGYHIDNSFKARNFSEAVEYLDLPTDAHELTKKLDFYKKALKFRTRCRTG